MMNVKQEFFDQHVEEVKQEIEFEESKIEHNSDLPIQIDNNTVRECELLQDLHANIKKESKVHEVKGTVDFYMGVSDIKKESCEFIEPKTESELLLSLTTHCDLPTLKYETTDHPGQSHSHKQDERIFKPLKDTAQHVNKRRRMRYPCPVCLKNFPSSKSRYIHVDGHFEKRYAVCPFCGRLMKKIEFFQHFFVHVVKNRINNHIADKSLKFNFSSKKLKRKNLNDADDKSIKTLNLNYILGKHLIIHSDDKPFKCDKCSKCYTQKLSLRRHLLIHSDKKPFKCDKCSKCFIYKSILQRHLIIHSDEKPFKCDKCSQCFARKPSLQRHLLIHSGEKPFKCNICSKSFSQKSHLLEHLIIHSGEKPFKCDICFKRFNRNSELKPHLLIHTIGKSFKCDICSKSFTSKHNLQRHLLIHNGEKPFKCDICSRGFSQKSDLQQHLNVHGDEKPFKCDQCSKCFNFKNNLKRHLKIHNI